MAAALRRLRNKLKTRGIYDPNFFLIGLLPLADIAKDILDTFEPYKQNKKRKHILLDILIPLRGIYHLSNISLIFIVTPVSVALHFLISIGYLVTFDFKRCLSSLLNCFKEISIGILCSFSLALRGLTEIAMTPLAWLRIPFRMLKEPKKFEDRYSIQRLIADGEKILADYTKQTLEPLPDKSDIISPKSELSASKSKEAYYPLIGFVMFEFYLLLKSVSLESPYYAYPSTQTSAPFDLKKIIKTLSDKRTLAVIDDMIYSANSIENKETLSLIKLVPLTKNKPTPRTNNFKINTLASLKEDRIKQTQQADEKSLLINQENQYTEHTFNECYDTAIKELEDNQITPDVKTCVTAYFAWFKRVPQNKHIKENEMYAQKRVSQDERNRITEEAIRGYEQRCKCKT